MLKPMTAPLPIKMHAAPVKRWLAILSFCAVTAAGTEAFPAGEGLVRETDSGGEAAETHLPADQPFTAWIHDPAIFEEPEGDRREMRQVVEEDIKTIKLDNLVPPIRFAQGKADISGEYLEMLREVLEKMRGRDNVRLHFIGHADSLPLSTALSERYEDNVGLSRERAGITAEYCQRALALPPEAISYEGVGDSRPVAANATENGRRLNRRVEVQVWYDEITEKLVEQEVIVPREVNRVKICRTETVCKIRYKEGNAHRARVKNLIAPLHYDRGSVEVPEEFLQQIRQTLENLGAKQNVIVKFTAHTDNLPLEGREKRIYGNHLGLSRANGRRVALAVQDGLGLPNGAVESEGKGATRPIAANDTQQGRVLNRRIEVDFWYDDPLQELPDEPQLCPEEAGAETITRVYAPPSGDIEPIYFDDGKPVVPPGYTEKLRRVMAEISTKTNVRLRFVGYTSNRRLNRRTARVYGNDIGWSMARARRALEAVSEEMGLAEEQTEFDGRGYVRSDDVVNTGFIEADSSHVQVQVIYDELVALNEYEGVEITRLKREVVPSDPFALNLMRITVDGAPLTDPNKCSSDVQRCTDLALEEAAIRFKHDSLNLTPRLNVTAWPRSIGFRDLEEASFNENPVRFRLYTNYRSFIERAEVRIFAEGQSSRDTPLAIIAMDDDGMASWRPEFESFSAPGRNLQYLVRVYDRSDRFDETVPQPLWLVDRTDPAPAGGDSGTELLAGYGENRLAARNIPLRGGTVRVSGTGIPRDHGVWLAGYTVPVDAEGSFVAEEILPEGLHTVEVAVLDSSGNGELFLRDLALKKSDWFTVGIADLTLAANKTNGPADLLAPDRPQYSDEMSAHGRLAFYSKGKFENGWSLTASADTREGPLDEIFANFLDKSPDALFRRMDPDYHYPTFGDDGSVVEDAPTQGKFYAKAGKDETYGLWGNFRIGYTDNDLAHVDRGLYGANLHYQPLAATGFGAPRLSLDGFAADPGTVAGRDEFRGTGGSLYFMSRQDVLEGSERLRVEVRDKDSNLVVGVRNLRPALDYDIDYLQGRILLAEPLSATAEDAMLVDSSSVGGNPVYLVARYEFSPGFDDPDSMATGGRVHYWLNDYVKIGLTSSRQEEAETDNDLDGADLRLRMSAGTWINFETGRSKGPGRPETTSPDGGYNFTAAAGPSGGEVEAAAHRVDGSISFKDFFDSTRGRLTYYYQDTEAGYSSPGQLTALETTIYGAAAALPLSVRTSLRLKADRSVQPEGLDTEAAELNLDHRIGDHWTLSPGVRSDSRVVNAPLATLLSRAEGKRTDAALRLHYDSLTLWNGYGFVQESLRTTGNREENGRIGVGGAYRLTERFKVDGEISEGDLGESGRLGTEYLYSDRTTLYLNYALENERTDNGLRARKGNMASGFRTRYSDSASVYLEERYSHGDLPTGLMHGAGVDLAPTDRLNLGANLDFGTLKDHRTGAEIKRTAAGLRGGYGFDTLKIASAVEYRLDDTEQPDATSARRTTWLLKNSLRYQFSPDWRLLGKLNHSRSESSLGRFHDGNFTEAVLGYAYRPVRHDRLNALLKYTYFYNLPAPEQARIDNAGPGVIQRSHIGALDVMYDLTVRWTLGGKYAYRHGEISRDRLDPEYFLSRASLYVLRADYHFLHKWDGLVEGRLLDLP
ncbi:MAG: OmpA family protein, partial [Desulfurivibrionaceae bacterium]